MDTEIREIQKAGMRIRYTLHIKKVKNISLKIVENGSVVVTSNAFVPKDKIDDFVVEKVAWIVKKQQKAMQRVQMIYEDVMVDDVFYLFAKPLKIVRIFSNQNQVRYDDQHLYVYYSDESKAHKSVVQFIHKMCEKEFIPIVQMYYEKLEAYRLAFPQIKLKTMKSRWGSCTPAKQLIVLNTRMLHYPKAFLEYVVLHELVHFIQPNHSASFYQIIAFHMPDYKQRQQCIR